MRTAHVFPLRDDREHVPTPWCWCSPTLAEPDGPDALPVYVHEAADPGGLWVCTIDDDEPADD